MKVGGFSFVRDAVRFDYPFKEAIRSILPLCDVFVLAVGKSSDRTLREAEQLDPKKVHVLRTTWNEDLKAQGGKVFAEETNKAFRALPKDLDWAFYIQSDEVLHEKYLPIAYQAMSIWKNDPRVEGLLFKYLHFYGNYNYVGASYQWYPNEIRVIRRNAEIFSYKDAQSFRKKPNAKLLVKPIDAYIYHYGYVRKPKSMAEKINLQHSFHESWQKNLKTFSYHQEHGYLKPFTGTHPTLMQTRIQAMDWIFTPDPKRNKPSLQDTIKRCIETWTGYRIGGFKNYILS